MPSTDHNIAWSFTVGAVVGMLRLEDEANYRESLAALKGKGRSQVSAGVQQGVNDLLTISKHLDPDIMAEIEAKLAERDLISFEKMMTILRGKHRGILKRGSIKNGEEYDLVRELLSDLESGLTNTQRRKLGEIELAYEEEQK